MTQICVFHMCGNDDDILVFVRTSFPSLCSLQDLLQCYQTSTSQMFNLQKSQLYIVLYNRRSKRQLRSIIGIEETTALCVYLGIPMVFCCPKKQNFHYLMDKVNSKLTAWKAFRLTVRTRSQNFGLS